jgi:predicted NAD/FAD-binding protein
MESVAIVGTGIAGMACAHRLRGKALITLFESCPEPGGHTHTREVPGPDGPIPVDTGFMVYNEVTYPLLTALFAELGVETVETDMSFGVQHRETGLEFCGTGLGGLFAQPINLLRPAFWGMLRDVVRFNRISTDLCQEGRSEERSLRAFLEHHRFGQAFKDQYLLPMTGAIWSTPPDQMLEFPAQTLLRFMYNHGLLGVTTHHQWRTVKGGSRQYRDKLLAPFRDHLHCDCPVQRIRRQGDQVQLTDGLGREHRFDRVVVATHADTALGLLEAPTASERRLLQAFSYSTNRITLHGDLSVMPRARRAWASWNYRLDPSPHGPAASTHYWMNRLQHIPDHTPVLVSLNDPGRIDANKIHAEFHFDHPTFTKAAIEAQRELPDLNRESRVLFCGSYFRYGFHEDGILAGYHAAQEILQAPSVDAQLAV